MTQLSGSPLAELAPARVKGGRLPAILSDGRRGFLLPDVSCLQIPLWTIASGQAKIYSEPNSASPVLAVLNSGALLEQYGLKTSGGSDTWIPVHLADGRNGYVGSQVKVVNQGAQVRIQKGPEDPGTPWLLKDGKIRPRNQRARTPREAAQRDILIGGALCAGGVLITVVSYSMVSDSGGTYLIMWGPALYGGYRFLKGIVGLLSSS